MQAVTAKFCRFREIHEQLRICRMERGVGLIYLDALDLQSHGIKRNFVQSVSQWRHRVGNVADNFLLLQIEPQRDLGVLQVIIPASRVGFIRPQRRRDAQQQPDTRHRDAQAHTPKHNSHHVRHSIVPSFSGKSGRFKTRPPMLKATQSSQTIYNLALSAPASNPRSASGAARKSFAPWSSPH